MSNNESDDENVVVIPVADSLSDGDKNTWRLNDSQFKYRMIDDTRWREALAEMWVQKTGAYEQGKLWLKLQTSMIWSPCFLNPAA